MKYIMTGLVKDNSEVYVDVDVIVWSAGYRSWRLLSNDDGELRVTWWGGMAAMVVMKICGNENASGFLGPSTIYSLPKHVCSSERRTMFTVVIRGYLWVGTKLLKSPPSSIVNDLH